MGVCPSRIMSVIGGEQSDRRRREYMVPAAQGGYDYEEMNSGLRSIDSLLSTHISFKNTTDIPVKLFWINYDGEEVPYRTLLPGQQCRQQTFVTHPWTYKSTVHSKPVTVRQKTVVFPKEEEELVEICFPGPLGWSTIIHSKRFPLDFQEQIKEALIAFWITRNEDQENRGSAHGKLAERSAKTYLLGDIPYDILLDIFGIAAPYVPDIQPMDPEEIARNQKTRDDFSEPSTSDDDDGTATRTDATLTSRILGQMNRSRTA